MKDLAEIKNTLSKHKTVLEEKYRVKRIGIFGSYARGVPMEESDSDILVDLYEPIGWNLIELKEFLESILEINVDLVTVKALKPQLNDIILNEVVFT